MYEYLYDLNMYLKTIYSELMLGFSNFKITKQLGFNSFNFFFSHSKLFTFLECLF